MLQAARQVGLDIAALQARVGQVLADQLYWFPVRHHSPTAARHVRSAIAERRPRVLFIEGPSEANDLVPFLVDRQTRPPVAIYSSYRDDDNLLGLAGMASPAPDIPARFAFWYPLLAYSPEYVAMQAAAEINAEVVLIDLPHHALLSPAAAGPGQLPGPAGAASGERLLAESGLFSALAERAGFRTWDQAWDSLFEFGAYAADRETFRSELATFCAAARASIDPAQLASDGTLERERFMWHTIRSTLKNRGLDPAEALVVSGGFHLFLARENNAAPPQPRPGTLYSTLVPYSFFRVSELAGYQAGNRAPQFYQALWELADGDHERLLSEHVVAILKRARREGEPVSSADAISITQHARLLAALRRRAKPILDDIHDAVITCCCKGDPEQQGVYLGRAIDAVDIGTRIGVVSPKMGRLPLVADFYAQVEALDLKQLVEHEQGQKITLDKREELDLRRSVFLHRLAFLGIPVATLVSGPDLGAIAIFREVWKLLYSPQVEAELIERNLYGDSIETAALARLKEALAGFANHAAETCRCLRDAVAMDLPTLAREIEIATAAVIACDTRFVSLSTALHHLQILVREAGFRARPRALLESLIEQAFQRTCFALPEAANAPEAEQEAVVDALRVVAETLLGDQGDRLDRDLFVHQVVNASETSSVQFLRGAFLGMLSELRVMQFDEVSAALAAFAQEREDRLVTAGDFLDGMLAVCRTSVLLGADHLVAAIDELLRAAEWPTFLVLLPRLRAAFERLHHRQRDSLADRVARRYGLREGEQLTELHTSVAAAAQFADIDQEVARILRGWDL